jgi:hypothetical protein
MKLYIDQFGRICTKEDVCAAMDVPLPEIKTNHGGAPMFGTNSIIPLDNYPQDGADVFKPFGASSEFCDDINVDDSTDVTENVINNPLCAKNKVNSDQ